jgi:hypothetical protein
VCVVCVKVVYSLRRARIGEIREKSLQKLWQRK